MGRQKLKLLLVEDNFDDQDMIGQALAEAEECGPRYNWFASDLVAVDHLSDAIHCLDRARFDAVLLDLGLPDSPVLLNTFAQVQLASPGTPIVALLDDRDESLCHRLLREGAQDVLVKGDIECEPLTRALWYGIERQRRSRALRSISYFDELTGFYSRWGFTSLASHDIAAAHAAGAPITMAVLEIEGLPDDAEDRDLMLLETSELLQNTFSSASLIGRLDATSFGLVAFTPGEPEFQSCVHQFHNQLTRIRQEIRVVGATVSLPDAGPCDVEGLLQEVRTKPSRKTLCCRIDTRTANGRAGCNVQRGA